MPGSTGQLSDAQEGYKWALFDTNPVPPGIKLFDRPTDMYGIVTTSDGMFSSKRINRPMVGLPLPHFHFASPWQKQSEVKINERVSKQLNDGI